MKKFLRLLLPCLLCAPWFAHAAPKLNVLFIISDDLNANVGSYGHPWVKTPHLDRLAGEGVRFDRAYCQFPICGASRASLLTGRRPNVTGVLGNGKSFRPTIPDTVTLPELFKQHGWFAARVGKLYHYGVPGDIGTDGVDDPQSWSHKVNPRGRDVDDLERTFTIAPNVKAPLKWGANISWLAADGTDEEQTDGIGATEAIKVLEAHRDRPFFLAVGFYRPHTPFTAPRKYFDLYPVDKVPLPVVPAGHVEQGPALAFATQKPEQLAMTDDLRREANRAYAAATTFMDAQVGRVLAALDRLKLRDTTIVVFTSDHGFHLGDHALWQKQSLFENSARVPLIIAPPGLKSKGRTAAGPVELIDIYPTLADLCGLPAPAYLDGKSLRAMLDDPSRSVKPGAFTQVQRGDVPGYAVSDGRFRYIEWGGGREGAQLYDLRNDPNEWTNLAADPAHATKVAELKRLIAANWQGVPAAGNPKKKKDKTK